MVFGLCPPPVFGQPPLLSVERVWFGFLNFSHYFVHVPHTLWTIFDQLGLIDVLNDDEDDESLWVTSFFLLVEFSQ